MQTLLSTVSCVFTRCHSPLIEHLVQTVGHADLFQDGRGNWWCVALSTRSGPDYKVYPMGRETVLTNATWKPGEWPTIQNPVRGTMSGWLLPKTRDDLPGGGYVFRPLVITRELNATDRSSTKATTISPSHPTRSFLPTSSTGVRPSKKTTSSPPKGTRTCSHLSLLNSI